MNEQIIASFCGDSVLKSCAISPKDGKIIVPGEVSGKKRFLMLEWPGTIPGERRAGQKIERYIHQK
jgi:hypothetical protein